MQGVSLQNVFCLLVWAFNLAFSQNQGQGRYRNANEFQGLLTAMETGLENDAHPFYSLTPSTPMPENINCYVEIPATRVGGQCVQMGSARRRGRGGGNRSNRRRTPMIWGCQAGVHLDMGSPYCAPTTRRTRNNRLG